MIKFKRFFLRNIIIIYKIQIFSFIFFILVSVLFNLDSNAHKYYNNSVIVYNFDSVFSIVMILLFGLFFWIALLYPFFWLVQIVLVHFYKISETKKTRLIIISILLYFMSIIALFSLYSIEQHQGFVERAEFNIR